MSRINALERTTLYSQLDRCVLVEGVHNPSLLAHHHLCALAIYLRMEYLLRLRCR